MISKLTIDEFEKAWDQLLDDFNLRDNEFMERTYNKRYRWAKPYNKDNYCAGMTSTQRSESANNMLKHHVPRNSSMNNFVQNYNNLLTSRYKVEQEAEHETKQVLQTNSLLFFELCLQYNVHMLSVVSFLIQ